MKKPPKSGEIIPWPLKFDLKMKLSLLFLITVSFVMQANSSYSQKTKISLDVGNATMEEVIDVIEANTEFKFIFNTKTVNLKRKVSISVKKVSIKRVLDLLFSKEGIRYEVEDRKILLTRAKMKASVMEVESVVTSELPQILVSGTITDQDGTPLPGANILEKGTTNGTQADFDGNFSISVEDESAVIVISYVGFATKEVNLNGMTNLTITLVESAAGLDEVVIVGYGAQKKVNLTGAISTVEFDEELENRPITNASQALGGTASGIWVSQNSGKPGSDEAQIRIRGWGTLNNANPLIIVDGVEGSFDQINPDDIKSISVLKDAASAAIYGSKAANGVVLVTTKTGGRNQEMEVNLKSYVGIQSLGRTYDLITNSAESMELSNIALVNGGGSPLFSEDLISDFRNGGDSYKYPNTDWYDALFKSATIKEHNISVKGGSERTSSYISLNYLNQQGIIPNTQSERYSARINVESNVKDWLTLGARVNYVRRNSKEPYADASYGSLGRVYTMLSGAAPYISPYTKDGRFGSVQAIDENGSLLYDNRNPLIDTANGKTTTEENFLTLNVYANVIFNDQLSLKTTISTNGNWTLMDKYNTSVFGYTDTGVETTTKNYNREGLEMNRTQVSGMQNNLFSTINYNENYGSLHDISAVAGIQVETNKLQNVFARRTNPPKEGLTQVDAGTSGVQGEGNITALNILSYFGRINYTLSDRYLFEANFRADGSSRFSKKNRWGYFPGFSAGWRLSQEKFIQNLDVFSNLKLRASWGQLGNQNLSSYWPYLTVINQSNDLSYNFNGGFSPGAAVTSLVDEDITWEMSSTIDFGVDLGLLDGKISIEADYFQKTTKNILVQLPIPLVLGGVAPPFENIGEMSNNGFEFIVNFDNHRFERNQLGFNVGGNLTYIDNKVTKFQGGNSPDQLYLIREGYSYRSLYGYNVDGIYQSDEEALTHMHSNGLKPRAGNLRYEDVNNDGKLNFEDKQNLGNTIPKYTFGLSSGLKYQGFDLNLLFQGIGGANVFTRNSFTNISYENRVFSTRWRDAWTPQNTDTDMPSFKFDNSWDNSDSSFWVRKINYLKLKNIQMGYSFHDSINSRLGMDKIYIYANAQNVFTIVDKNYEGYDPERNTFDSGGNFYPIPRIISIGINLNF
ncbi:TonB-linked SusC/RagA family outer membrane protein [Arenibacter sp. ARW7G5Y1]|nr:TonB-linked SusC/RagA family outer membrane protein [Arenibacter sp. ARW7G5Y1]